MTEGYNGWKNYPTWCVNLWLTNDEALDTELRDRARRALADGEDRPALHAEVGITANDESKGELAAALKQWVTDELAPDLGASFAADLLGYALGEVDWYELAEAALADLQ